MEINYDVHIVESVNTYIDFVKNMTSKTSIVNNKRIDFLMKKIQTFDNQHDEILKLYYEAILNRCEEYPTESDFKYNFFIEDIVVNFIHLCQVSLETIIGVKNTIITMRLY